MWLWLLLGLAEAWPRGGLLGLVQRVHVQNVTGNATNGTNGTNGTNNTVPVPAALPLTRACRSCPSDAALQADKDAREAYKISAEAAAIAAKAAKMVKQKRAAGIKLVPKPLPEQEVLNYVKEVDQEVKRFENDAKGSSTQRGNILKDRLYMPVVAR